MSKDLFGGPGVGRSTVSYKGVDTPLGSAFLDFGDDVFLELLIQNWTVTRSERSQEVVTLAETEHLYTFGKNLTRISISGLCFSTLSKNSLGSTLADAGAIPETWKVVRAKISGSKGTPLVTVTLGATDETFECVATSISYSGNINQEALVQVNLELLVLNEK